MMVKGSPLVASEARNESWPEAKAGWMFGRPPSVPTLSMLYLRREKHQWMTMEFQIIYVNTTKDLDLLHDILQ